MQLMRATTWTETSKAIGIGLPETLRIKPPHSEYAQTTRHRIKGDYSPALGLNVIFPIGLRTYLGPVNPFFSCLFLPFEREMFVLCLFHHIFLEVDNLIS